MNPWDILGWLLVGLVALVFGFTALMLLVGLVIAVRDHGREQKARAAFLEARQQRSLDSLVFNYVEPKAPKTDRA